MSALSECKSNLTKCRTERDKLRADLVGAVADATEARAQITLLNDELINAAEEIDALTAKLAACEASHPPPPPSGGVILAADPMTNPDPFPLWRGAYAHRLDGQQNLMSTSLAELMPGQIEHFTTGAPTGGPFRRLRVLDGEEQWGERTELSKNNQSDTFHIFKEGDVDTTDFWIRLDSNYPISSKWCSVMDWKQAQPIVKEDTNIYGMMLLAPEINWDTSNTFATWNIHVAVPDARGYYPPLYTGPQIKRGVWQHMQLAVKWSKDKAKGSLQLTVDDAPGPIIPTRTLKYEQAAPQPPIPSHLRMGCYHEASLPSCFVDYADLKVVKS